MRPCLWLYLSERLICRFSPLKGKIEFKRKLPSSQYEKTQKHRPFCISININFPLSAEKPWTTESRWFHLHPLLVAHPPPPCLVFQKTMTAPNCIIELPYGARWRRKGFYACLAWLAWRMHYALSAPANTHVNMQMHTSQLTTQLPYAQFPKSSALGIPGAAPGCQKPHIFPLKINVPENNSLYTINKKSTTVQCLAICYWGKHCFDKGLQPCVQTAGNWGTQNKMTNP